MAAAFARTRCGRGSHVPKEKARALPGLLLFLLGNENNYGLFWAGAETEDFPEEEEKKKFIGESRGRPMYKLMNDAAIKMKSINNNLPIAICNGDLLFVEIIAEECTDVSSHRKITSEVDNIRPQKSSRTFAHKSIIDLLVRCFLG